MDFQEFLQFVPKLITAELPAVEAHVKMAPLERLANLDNQSIENNNPRTAAVLMLCYPKNGETHLVLIVRNSYKGVHSAQIAFPGGKFEQEDTDFAATAIRETHEEVGIHPNKIEVVKPFTQVYIPPSNFIVYPFLGICKEEINFIPDPLEVAGIIELPMTTFLSDTIVTETELMISQANSIKIPAFEIEKHIVWGATAMMLSELKEVFKSTLNTKV
jgi:8-oxo-dGTP pyrophosphatase MutT (NUDIX family)